MLLDIILFPLFAATVSIIGIGFWECVRKVSAVAPAPTPGFLFPLLGAFAIGFVALVINFFSGVANAYSFGVITAFFVYGCCLINKDIAKSLGLICVLAALCTPLAADMQAGPDAGLYHLAHQRWIRDHEIIFGFAHLHARYGFSSFLEYTNALLWIGETFKFLSYMSALFFVSLLCFVFYAINSRNNIIKMFAFYLAIGMIIYDNYFIWKYGYADSAAGVAFALSIALGLYVLVLDEQHKETRNSLLLAFFILSAMAVALKVSSILAAIWAFFVFLVLLHRGLLSFKQVLGVVAFPAVFTLLWLLRGVFTTGCLLFPASWSCLDLPWNSKAQALEYSNAVTAWARHPHTGFSSLDSWSWLSDYWLAANSEFLIFFGVAVVIILVVAAVLRRFFETERLAAFQAIVLAGIVFAALALWFLKAPTERFGIGVLMIVAPTIALTLFGAPVIKNGFPTKAIGVLLIILMANNQGGFSIKGLSRFHILTVPQDELVEHPVFGVHGKTPDDLCWAAPNCILSDPPAPKTRSGYLFFEQQDTQDGQTGLPD
ncbi:MAG: hypothetical protein RIE06_23095 [Roseibium album]|uniref:LIC_10190 family membrane protein n=1 Tax=Roseibium album TaxID=311410 RepID=UPI0032EF0B56